MIKHCIATLFFISIAFQGKAQLIADGLPGCLDGTIFKEGTLFCGGGASSIFDLVGGEFVVNNVDGIVCCGPPFEGGDNEAYFQFGPLDISAYNNVTVAMDYMADPTGYEDDFPGGPSFGCTGTTDDNSHDQIVFTYIIDGTPIEDLYVHGSTDADFTGTWNTGPVINGTNLIIKVFAANKATAEVFRFSNLQVFTSPISVDAGPDQTACNGQDVNLAATGVGEWSGGLGVFSDVTDPNATYTPDVSENGTTVTLTYTAPPVTSECGLTINGPSDDMEITITSPMGTLSGGGNLCPGECATIDVLFSNGQEPYTLDLEFNSSVLPVGFGFSIPGFNVNETIEVCYAESGLFPSFDLGTNTLTLPPIVGGNFGSLSLNALSDASGCNNVPQNSTIDFTFLLKPIASPAMMEECNDGSGVAVFDFTTLTTTILNGNGGTVTFYEDAALTTIINPPYVGTTTTIYAVINGDNGCESDPVPVDLIMIDNGDAGIVTATCMGVQNCTICDSDGIPGEDISIDFTFQDFSIDYIVEIVYIINGVQDFLTTTIPGSGGSLFFTIDGDASFQVLSITPENDCIDVTDMPPAVNFIYILQPSIFPIGPISDCDPIVLPDINSLNSTGTSFYNTEPDGSGVNYNAGDVISSSILLYAIDGYLPDCADIEEVDITIEGSINLLTPPNDTVCGFYIFPNIPGQGTGSTVGYYTGQGGNGNNYIPGDTLFISDTIYLFDPLANCPSNEPDFSVLITNSIEFDSIAPILSCTEVILPNITGNGFTDSVRYFSQPFGLGNEFFIGDTIQTSDTLYVYDNTINCDQDSVAVIIGIGDGTLYNSPNNIANCGPFPLPQITGTNIGINAMYFTSPNGGGQGYLAGDTIFTTTTLYIFDTTTICNENQPTFNVVINDVVDFDISPYIVSCGSFTLPAITGVNLSGNEGYFTDKFGGGVAIPVGTVFTTDTTIYLYSGLDACELSKEIRIVFEEFNPGLANNYTICSSEGFINLFDGLIPPFTSGGEWNEQGSSNFDISDPNAVPIPSNLPNGTYRFSYTLSSPDCPTLQTVSGVEIVNSPDAGKDSIVNLCLGTLEIDLSTVSNTNGLTTVYEYTGSQSVQFNGSVINISDLSEGMHTVLAITTNVSDSGNTLCSDTARIDINLNPSASAGVDNNETICKNSIILLTDYLQNNDDIGTFECVLYPTIINGLELDPTSVNDQTIEVLHILNSSGNCEPDTSVLTFDLINTPVAGSDVKQSECGLGEYVLTGYIMNGDLNGHFEIVSAPSMINLNGTSLTVNEEGIVNLNYIVESASSCGNDTASFELTFTDAFQSDFFDNTCNSSYDYEGQTFTANDNTGTLMLTSVSGCDSIVNIEITFNSPSITPINETLCVGDSIIINGKTYKEGNLIATDTLAGMASSGCDSILSIAINLEQVASSDLNVSTCDETYSVTIGTQTFDVNNPNGSSILKNMAQNGCDSLVNVNIQVEPFSVIYEELDPECEEDDGVLILTDLLGSDSLYFQTDQQQYAISRSDLPFELPLETGSYNLMVHAQDEDCIDELAVTINDPIVPDAEINAIMLSDSSWQLSVETEAVITTYFWTAISGSLSCWDCPDPIFTGQGDVQVIYDYGTNCTDNTSTTLIRERNNDFHLPNIISANNDGINDEFQIFVNADNNLIISSFIVFDRWGNKMTNVQNLLPQNGDVLWNGKFNNKAVNPGVYLYLMQIIVNGKVENVKGEITVLR